MIMRQLSIPYYWKRLGTTSVTDPIMFEAIVKPVMNVGCIVV